MSDEFDRGLLEEALPAHEPPAGFADRVVAAVDVARPSHLPRTIAVAAACVAATIAVFLLLERNGARELGGSGSLATDVRQEVRLGGRGTAVAEAGAALSWNVDRSGDARVEQSNGNVFYRVERGGPFWVRTPAGDIEVRGTCFRVEVQPMLTKQHLIGASVGAAVAATVVVTVYEGRVQVRNAHGATEVSAGGTAGASSDRAPSAALAAVGGDTKKAAAMAGAPPANATRDDLLVRDDIHRQQIAALEAQVKDLQQRKPVVEQRKEGKPERKFSGFTHDELVAMANNCEVRMHIPHFGGSGDEGIDPAVASRFGLSSQDVDAYNQAIKSEGDKLTAALRQLYYEVIGDRGDNLEPRTLFSELEGKLGRRAMYEARVQLSRENAGLVPPLDPATSPPAYRLLKLMSQAGDQFEQALTPQLGADKARQLSQEAGGSSMAMSGCEGDDAKMTR